VVDYETYCRIRDHLVRQQLTPAQTARALGLDTRTVAKWAEVEQFRARQPRPRPSKLDAFKGQIVRWLDAHPYSAQQIYQRLAEAGFDGGITIVKDYVHRIRPRRQPAFLKLDFEPGECAQVDWGELGTVAVGNTRRRLSFFLMVLCYSRRMYLEFTVSQEMEFFLACHENAFAAFGAVPARLMVDNLKSAVLKRLVGQAPVFNPKYLDFSRHWGFEKNFLAGQEFINFSAVQPAAQLWVDTVADVRVHGATNRRPVDMFEEERAHLKRLNPVGFDLARVRTVSVNKQFRVALDSNTYSVPSRHVGQRLTMKAWADRVCLYAGDQLVARHVRSMQRNTDIELAEHAQQLTQQRKSAREQRLLVQFLALSPRAQAYREGLEARRVNARVHLRQILALAEMHGREAVARAMDDGLELAAFSAEYIAHILAARQRIGAEPAALQLTRSADLLELEIPEPDLSIYDRP
jgi:transposase